MAGPCDKKKPTGNGKDTKDLKRSDKRNIGPFDMKTIGEMNKLNPTGQPLSEDKGRNE